MKSVLSRAALRRALLGTTATSFAVLMLAANGAWAQDQNGSMETVTVTGFRESIAASLEVKQHSQEIIEAISAEDIGKLPDNSIADSLARLPGLASQRDNNGHWQDLSVNGLPPSMSATLFNGRPQASTDNNRVIQFDQYPAEIMSQVKVYKTSEASLTNGAIATIDLETIRPLDYDKTTFEVGGQGEYDTRGALQPEAGPYGYHVNVSYIDQFAGDKVGVMIGIASMSAPNQIYAQHPYGFNQPNDVVTGLQDQVRSDTLMRNAVISTVQYRPTNNLQSRLTGSTPTIMTARSCAATKFRRPAAATLFHKATCKAAREQRLPISRTYGKRSFPVARPLQPRRQRASRAGSRFLRS